MTFIIHFQIDNIELHITNTQLIIKFYGSQY